MAATPDPFDALRKLGERLAELADGLGLQLHSFSAMPNFDGGQNYVQCLFVIGDMPEQTDDEQALFDAKFEELAASFTSTVEDEADVLRRQIEQRIREKGGFLDE